VTGVDLAAASLDTAAAMGLELSAAEARAYREDGFFAREAVFSAAEVEVFRDAAERVVRLAAGASESGDGYAIDGNRYVEAADSTVQFEHRPGSSTIRVIEPFHHFDERFDALLDDPRIVEPMRGVIGSRTVALWTDKLNLKRPLEGSGFRWHQDSPYWTHACSHVDRLPNVMLMLDDAHEGNGCFRVVRGSHTRGCLPGIYDETTLGPLFTDPAHVDEASQVLLEVPAGSLIFFSPHTVHGSQPNESSEPRRALVLTYQPGGEPMFKLPGTRNCGTPRAA
jgi:ectoine hydroxylase